MIKVTGLFIYPIKSLQGIELREAEVLERGFKHDRRWIIVDAENNQITQRTHPHLSQIKIRIESDNIVASHNGFADLEIPLTISQDPKINVTVWNEQQVEALEADSVINSWISKVAKSECRLAFMPEDGKRAINPERARNNENVSFADGYPYLIVSEESLEDLNSRMEKTLPMHRFRPNIVVAGEKPYGEDGWKDFKIGTVDFYGTNACKRCVFTTINQETGEKGVEPLKTLATYRREGSEVIFGLNAIASSDGIIKTGDHINFK